MQKDFTIVVLLSGRGSNLLSLLNHAERYTVTKVISNKAKAAGLAHARSAQIPAEAFSQSACGGVKEQKAAIYRAIREADPDLIALAGYMQIVEPEFIHEFQSRMVNIHPSLLPKYPGLNTHQRAIDAGDTEHGCSVQFVDVEVDQGPVIAQATCEVHPDDTAESLAARLLPIEHQLYPWSLNQIAAGEIALQPDGRISYSKAALASARSHHFRIRSLG